MHVQMYVQMHLQNQVVNVEYDENLDIGIPQNQRKYSDAVHIAESKHQASDMDMDGHKHGASTSVPRWRN